MSKLPDWFDGTVYDKGDVVRNPFSGEEFELMPGNIPEDGIKRFKHGLDWFRKHNLEAYKILLD